MKAIYIVNRTIGKLSFLAFRNLARLCICLSIAIPMTANATIIDNGAFTTDDDSGLDWLDMAVTFGQSYDHTASRISVGGSLEDWRFATSSEFDTLMANAIGGPFTEGFASSQFTALKELTGLLGQTFGFPGSSGFVVGYVESAALSFADARQFGFVNGDMTGYVRPVDSLVWDACKSCTSTSVGSYLVRTNVPSPVPEPSQLALLALGLLGLGFSRRRKTKPLTA